MPAIGGEQWPVHRSVTFTFNSGGPTTNKVTATTLSNDPASDKLFGRLEANP